MKQENEQYTDTIRKSLKRIEQANDVNLSGIRQTIEFVQNRIAAIRRVNWQVGDNLESELTKVMVNHVK